MKRLLYIICFSLILIVTGCALPRLLKLETERIATKVVENVIEDEAQKFERYADEWLKSRLGSASPWANGGLIAVLLGVLKWYRKKNGGDDDVNEENS